MHTSFANLLDLAVIAVPSDLLAQGLLPHILLIAPASHDDLPTNIAWNPSVAPACGWAPPLTPSAVFRLHSQESRGTSEAKAAVPFDRLPDPTTAQTTLKPTAESEPRYTCTCLESL